MAAMVHVERTVQPDMAAHAQYQPFFHAYTRTYPALKPIIHQQAAGRSAVPQSLNAPAIAGALQPRVAPSLLAADQAALGADCKRMQQEGADWLHVVRRHCAFRRANFILYLQEVDRAEGWSLDWCACGRLRPSKVGLLAATTLPPAAFCCQ